VAKATTAGPGRSRAPQSAPAAVERENRLVEIWRELRKVTWPTVPELVRMTQIVVATVLIFALLIGGVDLVLSYVVKPLYSSSGTISVPTG